MIYLEELEVGNCRKSFLSQKLLPVLITPQDVI